MLQNGIIIYAKLTAIKTYHLLQNGSQAEGNGEEITIKIPRSCFQKKYDQKMRQFMWCYNTKTSLERKHNFDELIHDDSKLVGPPPTITCNL